MGHTGTVITLYTSQTDAVLRAIQQEKTCFCREEYVKSKYQESAPIFLTAYRWFAWRAAQFVPKPPRAELPYWAFADWYRVEQSGGYALTLRVPVENTVLFDVYDWNKVLRLTYLGETEQ